MIIFIIDKSADYFHNYLFVYKMSESINGLSSAADCHFQML